MDECVKCDGTTPSIARTPLIVLFSAMTPSTLFSILRVLEAVAAVSGLVLNVTLAFLICFRGNPTLKAYSRVLVCNCIVDMAFSVVGYVVEMVRVTGMEDGTGEGARTEWRTERGGRTERQD